MQTAASNNLVLTDLSSFTGFADSQPAISHRGFYQVFASDLIRSVHTRQVLLALGDRLVVLAEQAHALRRMDTLERVSKILVSLPLIRQYEAVGLYYQALCFQNFGRGDIQHASSLLERIAENAPTKYRIRAIISLGANSYHQCDSRSALSLYYEASRFAFRDRVYDPYATLTAQRMVGVINSLEGNHRGALAFLENLFPLAHAMRSSQPHVYYDYMNSLAVELCAVGRLEEAKNVSEIVLASPFAPAYPEWRETGEEIELRRYHASRSKIGLSRPVVETVKGIGRDVFSQAQNPSSVLAEFAADSVEVTQGTAEASNILPFPVRAQSVGGGLTASSRGTTEPARVLIMSERNKTVGEGSNAAPQTKKSYGDLDGRQRLLKIMELTAAKDIADDELLEILESIERILFRQKDPPK